MDMPNFIFFKSLKYVFEKNTISNIWAISIRYAPR
jgi:hypothetical protein